MIDWLGIGHLFELSEIEAVTGFFTPLAIFAVFFVAHVVLPAIRVPGYVINPETGGASELSVERDFGLRDRVGGVVVRVDGDAAGVVLRVVVVCGGRGDGVYVGFFGGCGVQVSGA